MCIFKKQNKTKYKSYKQIMYNCIQSYINSISEMTGAASEAEVFQCLVLWSKFKGEECH